MNSSLLLTRLGEKTLPQLADPNLVTYCPSMDLVAVGTTDQQVLIYRLNGQRVYGAAQKNPKLHVESVKWKPNGQLLAVAWNDGTVRLVGAESSKIVHQFSTGEEASGITCMGWGSNLTNKTKSQKAASSWSDTLVSDAVISESKILLDLPRDLSLIDIEGSLPKLSPLAAAGSSEDVFCSRSSLDALFRPFDPKDNNAVDVMIIGTKEGEIHLTIYDSFVVGSFKTPTITHGMASRLVLHAAHERSSTHALLMKASPPDGIFFVPMDLRFISTSSDYLSLLASRSTALQNLLRYIHQVQILMVAEWKSTLDLPSKFLRNINETLAEKKQGDIVQLLYHSVATGHTFPDVKEWLVDELSERGHKRWEKAVVAGLENIRRLVHENMLPALERCSVILSRFSGIAKFQGPNDTVGFSSHQISLIVDTVACLHLVSSKILIRVVDELDLFVSFSNWLRYEIDRLATDSSTTPKEEDLEKEASIDHSKVLLYLQTCMTSSPLEVYFGDDTSDDYQSPWNQSEQSISMFDMLHKQLQKQEKGQAYIKSLPQVEFLCKYLAQQAHAVFSQVAETEKRNVLFGKPVQVGNAESNNLMDMRLNMDDELTPDAFVAFVPKDLKSCIQVTHIKLSIENGISTTHSMNSSVIKLGAGQVKDVKIFDETTLLVLWKLNEKTHLLSIPYLAPRGAGLSSIRNYHMEYTPQDPKAGPAKPRLFGDDETKDRFATYEIQSEGSFVPGKLEIRRQSGRNEANNRRILILGEEKQHYKVFSLPAATGKLMNGRDEDVTMSSEV